MQLKGNKKFSYLDEFKILQTLGSGYHAQVKLAEDENGNLYAIKRYKKQTATMKTLQHQLNVMKILRHDNLVKLYDVRENATYKRKDETSYKCYAIILEYVGGGELFDFVAETGNFSEKVSRTYFHQMMNGLHFMHTKGYAHRDIKPENILLGRDFTLKLADFGFTCPLRGKDGTGILRTKLGTQGYMAPQIPLKKYRGKECDIFAAGIILFIMYAGNPPFEKASPNDPYYKLIRQKNYITFWRAHSRNRTNNFFSEGFKDLFVRMVAEDPSERPTIEQIATHPWVRGPICTQLEIKKQFQSRKKILDVIMNKKRQQQQAQKRATQQSKKKSESIMITNQTKSSEVYQNLLEIYQSELLISRQLTHLQPKNPEDFTVSQNISYTISALKYFFSKSKIQLQDQFQVLFEKPSIIKVLKVIDQIDSLFVVLDYQMQLENSGYNEDIEILIKFGETMEDKIVLCFECLSGNKFYYKRILKEIRNLFEKC